MQELEVSVDMYNNCSQSVCVPYLKLKKERHC